MLRTILNNRTFEIDDNDTVFKKINRNEYNNYDDENIEEKEQELIFVYSSKIKSLEEELVNKNNEVNILFTINLLIIFLLIICFNI